MKKTIGRCLAVLATLFTLAATNAIAQQPADLAGTWQGKMALDANTSLTIQFVFTKRPDGSYAALLNSPDNGAIKNVAANSVTYAGGLLTVQVPSLSGSYSGTLAAGKFEGKWTQQGSALPLTLAPYTKPVLAKAALDTLIGAWVGTIPSPVGNVTLIVRFKNEKGELQGTIANEQAGGQEAPVSDIEFADNKISFKVPRANADFSGTVANGVITATLKQPGPGMPPDGLKLSLKKGDYAPPVIALKLDNAAFAKVSGTWTGKLPVPQAPKGNLTLIFRIESNSNGQYVGFTDSPDQGAKGIPMAEATLDGDKVTFKMPVLRAEFTGTLAGKTITGTFTQGGMPIPLNVTKP